MLLEVFTKKDLEFLATHGFMGRCVERTMKDPVYGNVSLTCTGCIPGAEVMLTLAWYPAIYCRIRYLFALDGSVEEAYERVRAAMLAVLGEPEHPTDEDLTRLEKLSCVKKYDREWLYQDGLDRWRVIFDIGWRVVFESPMADWTALWRFSSMEEFERFLAVKKRREKNRLLADEAVSRHRLYSLRSQLFYGRFWMLTPYGDMPDFALAIDLDSLVGRYEWKAKTNTGEKKERVRLLDMRREESWRWYAEQVMIAEAGRGKTLYR